MLARRAGLSLVVVPSSALRRLASRSRPCRAAGVLALVLATVLGAAPARALADDPPPNLLSAMNPSFERGTDGWTVSSGNVAPSTSQWAADGTQSLHMYGNGPGDVSAWSAFVPVAAGTTYSGRVAAKMHLSKTGIRVSIEWFTATGSSAFQVDTGPLGHTVSDNGQEVGVTATAPATATRARLRIVDDGTGETQGDVDAAMLVQGSFPTSYYAVAPTNLLANVNPSFELGGRLGPSAARAR